MATETKNQPAAEFEWECQPAAAALVHELVDDFCDRSPAALKLQERLLRETGTRLFDWVDHISLGSDFDRAAIADAGFTFTELDGIPVAEHTGGMFPVLRLDGNRRGLAIKAESVLDFLAANGMKDTPIHGAPWSRFR